MNNAPGQYQCSVCRAVLKVSADKLAEVGARMPDCGGVGTRPAIPEPRTTSELTAAAAELGLTYARRYAKAITKWVAAGKPKRSDEDVARILAICQSNECGKYAVNALIGGRCTVCGCRVNSSQMALANKIRMATEECPQQRWKQES